MTFPRPPQGRAAARRHLGAAPTLGLLTLGLLTLGLLTLGLPLLAPAAQAQAPRRDFSCVGAEELEDEVFAVPFRRGSSQLSDEARSGLAAAAQAIRDNPARGVCVLGHADREGGQQTNVRLAAARARAVSEALTRRFGVDAAQLRSEARVAGFSRRTGNRETREASIVLMPTLRPAAPGAPAAAPASPPRPAPATPPAPPPGPPPAAPPPPEAPARRPAEEPARPVPGAPARPAPEPPRDATPQDAPPRASGPQDTSPRASGPRDAPPRPAAPPEDVPRAGAPRPAAPEPPREDTPAPDAPAVRP